MPPKKSNQSKNTHKVVFKNIDFPQLSVTPVDSSRDNMSKGNPKKAAATAHVVSTPDTDHAAATKPATTTPPMFPGLVSSTKVLPRRREQVAPRPLTNVDGSNTTKSVDKAVQPRPASPPASIPAATAPLTAVNGPDTTKDLAKPSQKGQEDTEADDDDHSSAEVLDRSADHLLLPHKLGADVMCVAAPNPEWRVTIVGLRRPSCPLTVVNS